MKIAKLTLFVLILGVFAAFAQNLKIAWISDTHIGAPGSDTTFLKHINLMNETQDLAFLIHTGDVSEIGSWEQLENAENMLKSLKVKYFAVPGNHDTKWTNMGGMEFVRIFGDDKFRFDTLNYSFIGLNSGIILRGGGGHFAPEQIEWLKAQLNTISDKQEIYFFTHIPMSDIDNWYKVVNLLRKKNLKAIFVGHGHANKDSEVDMIPQIQGLCSTPNRGTYGFNLIDISKDDLKITTVGAVRTDSSFSNTQFKWYDKKKLARVNTLPSGSKDFTDYKVVTVHDKIDLDKTMLVSPVVHKNGFLAATLDGGLYNYSKNMKRLWAIDLDARIVSRPIVVGDYIYAGTVDGDLCQIDFNTGEVLQTLGINEPITSQIVSFPIFFRERQTTAIVFGTASGILYAYEATELTPVWKSNEAKGRIESIPVVLSDRVIYSAWDGMTYCLDIRTGKLNWKWSENVNFYYSTASCMPVTNGDYIWFVSPDKTVSCVDVLLGKTQWKSKEFTAWESIGLSDDGKTIWIKSLENGLHALNALTGKKIKSFSTKWGVDTNPVQIRQVGDAAVFGLQNGSFMEFKKDKLNELFFLGQARGLSIEKMGDLFIASNMDGRILTFSLK